MTARAHKSRALAISLGIHVSVFFGLMYMPPISLDVPQPSPSEYQQAFAGKEDKIVWYKFRELPSITPATPKAHRELRAEVKARQAVVSSPKNAPKRDQVVISPVPDVELPPLDLPNLIAVKLPPKPFTTPPDVIKPAAPQIQVPDGPQEIVAQALGPVNLPTEKLPGKNFVPPSPREAPPKPEIKVAEVDAAPIRPLVASAIPTEKLPARAYVPPAARPAEPRREIPAVTDVERPAATAPMVATLPSQRLPSRAFVPPPKKEPAPKPDVPQPIIDGPPGDVTIAIAGLNPALTATKLPAASSPGQFSAGQKVNPQGATSDGSGKGIVAPDLFAHSEEKAKADLLAMTLAPNRTTFSAQAQPYIEPALPKGNGAIRVGNAPDPRFNGRDVYMLAIQMANLTSVSGDWLMWYADHDDPSRKPDVIAAPVPHRKVDPRYIASAVSDHVQGRVTLYCVIDRAGSVGSIELVNGIDDRLNRSAEEALAKWEFYPATKNGQPVAVDVVVEIPFTLDDPATSHLRR